MTRSGDEYVRGLRDGRTVLLNGERVADVTTRPSPPAYVPSRNSTISPTIRPTVS